MPRKTAPAKSAAKPKTEPGVEVVVTVADSHLSQVEAVATRLRAKGLSVSNTLATSGVITGSVPRSGIAELGKVAGVAAVEASGEVRIAPPDADIQ